MIKGLDCNQVYDLLLAERRRLDQISAEAWEAGEKYAQEAAAPALTDLFNLIDQQIITKLARSGIVRIPLDQRILNSRKLREQLLPTLQREFPGFYWEVSEDPDTLVCFPLPPTWFHRLICRFKKS